MIMSKLYDIVCDVVKSVVYYSKYWSLQYSDPMMDRTAAPTGSVVSLRGSVPSTSGSIS